MSVSEVLQSVADQINAGALGPNVTASTSGAATPSSDPRPRGETARTSASLAAPGAMARAQRSAVLPDSVLDRFRQFRGDGDDSRFSLGDEIETAAVEFAGKVTQRQLYKAAAIETDLSIAEIRLLHETARATDDSLRAEFLEPLTFQHFRVLRFLDDRAQRRGYLRWCVDSADDFGGRLAPAAVLARKVRRELGVEPPEPTAVELAERAAGLLRRALEIENTPERTRKKLQMALETLEQA